MNWTLDQLEAFVMAVNEGSFSAAGRKLGKAQSRISTAIANLEIDLGLTLFDRSHRLPILTPAGTEMFMSAQAVLEQTQRFSASAMSLSMGDEVSLRVALDEALPIESFDHIFVEVSKKFPMLRLSVLSGAQQDIAHWVQNDQADLGIMFNLQPMPPLLEFVSIGQFKHSLVVSRHHPLAKIPVPTLLELNQYRQLVIRNRINEQLGVTISSQHWFMDSYHYITGMVCRQVGWALVPEHVARSEWYQSELVELSTEHLSESLLVEMGIVKRRDRGRGPVMNWFYEQLTRVF